MFCATRKTRLRQKSRERKLVCTRMHKEGEGPGSVTFRDQSAYRDLRALFRARANRARKAGPSTRPLKRVHQPASPSLCSKREMQRFTRFSCFLVFVPTNETRLSGSAARRRTSRRRAAKPRYKILGQGRGTLSLDPPHQKFERKPLEFLAQMSSM